MTVRIPVHGTRARIHGTRAPQALPEFVAVSGNVATALSPSGIAVTEGQTGIVATVVATGGSPDSYTYSKVSGPSWLTVASNGQVTASGTQTDADDGSIVIRATNAAGNADFTRSVTVDVAGAATALYTIDETNYGATSSAGKVRRGVAFEKGLVPSGNRLLASVNGGGDVDAQLAAEKRWADGSLQRGFITYEVPSTASAGTVTVTVKKATGTQPASSFNPWTALAAYPTDITAKFINVCNGDADYTLTSVTGTPVVGDVLVPSWYVSSANTAIVKSVAGSTIRMQKRLVRWATTNEDPVKVGSSIRRLSDTSFTGTVSAITHRVTQLYALLESSLKTAITTTTRRRIVDQTANFCRIWCWDDFRSSGEQHLVVEWHVDIHHNDAGVIQAIEVTAVPTKDYWPSNPFGVEQAYDVHQYDFEVYHGATRLSQYNNVIHTHRCRFASHDETTGNGACRKHWINVSGSHPRPTFSPVYSATAYKQLIRSGLLPPYEKGYSYTPIGVTYAPLGLCGHRGNIAATGGYSGRGITCNFAARAFVTQSAGLWAELLKTSQGGLHVFYHVRDHRNGPNGDTSRTLIPYPFTEIPGPQTYSTLPDPLAIIQKVNNTGFSAIEEPTFYGDTGLFQVHDTAHQVDYAGPAGFVFGEQYLLDTCLSGMDVTIRYEGELSTYAYYLYADNTTRSVRPPATTPHGYVPDSRTQDRTIGWAMNMIRAGWVQLADNDPHLQYVKNLMKNWDAFLTTSFASFPQWQRDKGPVWVRAPSASVGPWQQMWQTMASAMMIKGYDLGVPNARGFSSGYHEFLQIAGNYTSWYLNNYPYASDGYYNRMTPITSDGNWTTGALLETDEVGLGVGVGTASMVSNVLDIGDGAVARNGSLNLRLTTGDKLRFTDRLLSQVPTGLSATVVYYPVNINPTTGTSCNISTTPTGAAITGIGDVIGNSNFTVHATMADMTWAGGGHGQTRIKPQTGDERTSIMYAAAEMCFLVNHTGFNSSQKAAVRAFVDSSPDVGIGNNANNGQQMAPAWRFNADEAL